MCETNVFFLLKYVTVKHSRKVQSTSLQIENKLHFLECQVRTLQKLQRGVSYF